MKDGALGEEKAHLTQPGQWAAKQKSRDILGLNSKLDQLYL
jgi:hypothetical protein